MQARRNRLLQFRQQVLDRIDHLYRVGAGLALDRQALGLLALEPGVGAQILHRILDVGDVGEPHRRAVAPGDDDLAEAIGVEQLVVGVERDRPMRALEDALRPVDRGRRQRSAHIFQADAARRQSAGVDLNMHGVLLLPEDSRFGDAGHSRQLLRQDRVGVIVDAVDRQRVGMDCVDQYRPIGRVGLAVGRRVRQILRQQAGGGIDRLLHVLRRAVDVALEIELQRDQGRTDPAHRGHLGEAGQRGELLFERRRHRRGHRIRARSGIIDLHGDCREIYLRQRGDRQQIVRADAEHQDAEHQQRGTDRPPDKRFGNAHRPFPRKPLCRVLMLYFFPLIRRLLVLSPPP